MSASTPEELHRQWGERFSAGDLDGLVSLYEEDADLLPEPSGEPVHGKEAIRNVLSGWLATQARF